MNQGNNRLKLVGDNNGPSFLENPRFQWLKENSNLVFYSLIALIALFILIYKLSSYRSSQSETDYFTAEREYQKIVKNLQDGEKNESLNDSLTSLENILKTNPDLSSKYEGILTQAFLLEGDYGKASSHAKNIFSRVKKNDLLFYLAFSEITIFLANQEFDKALEKSQNLKNELEIYKEHNPDAFSYLEKIYGYNLIRIPFIQQQMNKNIEALTSWKHVDEYFYISNSENPYFLEARTFLENMFSNENITLKNYIQNQINTFEKLANSK